MEGLAPVFDDNKTPLRLVVLGASAGGIQVFKSILAGLPEDFGGAVLVVLHMMKNARSQLPEVLSLVSKLPVVAAEHETPIERGKVYVATPNRHLLVDGDRLVLSSAATENGARPAIDATMRAAAVHHGPRVVAVLGSGYLDDGVAGLEAVASCGGVTVVQSPEDAEVDEMPNNALAVLTPDHVAPAEEISDLLTGLVTAPVGDAPEVPKRLRLEADLAAGRAMSFATEHALGTPTPYACPDCGGNLWDIGEGHLERFRCHTGHAYSAQHLESQQALGVSEALWTALRALRERAALLERIAERTKGGFTRASDQAEEITRQADLLEQIILEGPNLGPFLQAGAGQRPAGQ